MVNLNVQPPALSVGLLLAEDRRHAGVRKSLALLAGRLVIALIIIFVGLAQIQRIIARDYNLFRHASADEVWDQGHHDNNILLIEFGLALPFALGWRTGLVSRLLALVCAMEAVVCWPIWGGAWPTFSYTVHARLHFFRVWASQAACSCSTAWARGDIRSMHCLRRSECDRSGLLQAARDQQLEVQGGEAGGTLGVRRHSWSPAALMEAGPRGNQRRRTRCSIA